MTQKRECTSNDGLQITTHLVFIFRVLVERASYRFNKTENKYHSE